MGTTARYTAASVTAALALFAASLFVFDRGASAGIDRVYRWVEGESQLHGQLVALPDKSAYEVLVLGSSRAFEAIHPSAIERGLGVKAYKEAGKGKGLRYAYEFYRLYRDLVGKPRVVVYGVDYFMFGMPSDEALLRRFDVASSNAGLGTGSFVPLQTLARKEVNDRAIVRILERAQQRLVSAMGEFDPEHNQADMATYTGPPVSLVVPRAEPARYRRVPYARFPGLEGEFLTRLLDACAADGVPTMFVYPPDYLPTRRTNFEHEAFVREFRRLIAGTPNAFFYDYDDPDRFPLSEPALFWDGGWGNSNSHLSRRGAEVFARLYIPDLASVLGQGRGRWPRP
jgi:hypothetical protein